jgi:D-alanyl-D-alanine carboxypeptidase
MRHNNNFLYLFLASLMLLTSCSKPANAGKPAEAATSADTQIDEPDLADAIARLSEANQTADANQYTAAKTEDLFGDSLQKILLKAEIPPALSQKIISAAGESPSFILDLLSCMEGDPYLRTLVDKQHALPEGYAPDDLVELKGGSYQAGRNGLMLRKAAADALEEMAAAAKAEGITLVASSTYRSYNYQVTVYNRVVAEMGQEAADRESARPGRSQHQTGLVVDFGSIDDSFAETKAGRWMVQNANRFGWSLSFPDGYEAVTGYRWESWHYRYVGQSLASFIDTYFDGIQQFALRFIHEWESETSPQSTKRRIKTAKAKKAQKEGKGGQRI